MNKKTPKYPGVYKITNLINGKIYIGEAINIQSRWIEHKCSLRNNYKENEHLQNSWNKYGENNFSFEVIEACDIEDLLKREHYWASELDSHNRGIGYNIRPTSEQSKSLISQETREKIRIAMTGHVFSKERNRKISIAKTGIPRSEELKSKLSEFWKDKYEKGLAINPMIGKNHTKETKKKIADKAKSRPHPPKKKVEVFDLDWNKLYELEHKEAIAIYTTSLYYWIKNDKPRDGKRFKITEIQF